jgi:hypothetical protein
MAYNPSDEALFNDEQKKSKAAAQAAWDALDSQYQAAMASGDTARAQSLMSQRDTIASDFDKNVRQANYGYSGGEYGTDTIALGNQRNAQGINITLPSASSQADYINELQNQQINAARQQLRSAYEQNVIDLDAAKAQIPQQYQQQRNMTDANYMKSRADYNEWAAANGLNNGASGQANLAMNVQNQANQNAINVAEGNALAEIETQRARLKAQYQNAVAEAINSGNLARAQTLYEDAVRVDNSLVSTALNQAQLDMQNRQWNYQLDQDRRSEAQNRAATLAGFGDFSGYLDLGYTPEQVQMMTDTYQSLQAAQQSGGRSGGYSGGSSSSGSSSGSRSSSSSETSNAGGDYSRVIAAMLQDGSIDSVKAAETFLHDYGYDSAQWKMTDIVDAWKEQKANDIMARARELYGQGAYNTATQLVNQDNDVLSDAQKNMLLGEIEAKRYQRNAWSNPNNKYSDTSIVEAKVGHQLENGDYMGAFDTIGAAGDQLSADKSNELNRKVTSAYELDSNTDDKKSNGYYALQQQLLAKAKEIGMQATYDYYITKKAPFWGLPEDQYLEIKDWLKSKI